MSQAPMDLFYRFFSAYFPELLILETRQEQQKALWQARQKSSGVLSLILLSIPAMVLVIWTQGFRVFGLASWFARGVLAALIGGILGALLGLPLEFLLHRGRIRTELRQALVKQGIAVCLECGYDLRAQTEPRCPECGHLFAEELLSRNRPAE